MTISYCCGLVKIYAYIDGASRGNPGIGASGYLILDNSRKRIDKQVFYNGVCTNNVSEYKAAIAAIRKTLELFGSEVELVLSSDSSLVINQLAGRYRLKNQNMKSLNAEAKDLLTKFKSYRLRNVKRSNRYIEIVDRELNRFLDGRTG